MLIKRAPGRSRIRGKARVIGHARLASAPNTPPPGPEFWMETMILVAGLAVAGLAGIAAAFYFSMRPGGSRVRAAGPDPAADRRVPASRSRTSPPSSGRSDRSATPERSARADRPARSDRPARTGASAGPAGSGSGRGAERTGASTVIDFTG